MFALVGLALGMSVARDGKLAGFVVGIAVIFAYYVVFLLAESLTKGYYADPEAVKHGGRFLARISPGGRPTSCSRCSARGALVWRARYTEGGFSLRVPDGSSCRVEAFRARRARRTVRRAAPARRRRGRPRRHAARSW